MRRRDAPAEDSSAARKRPRRRAPHSGETQPLPGAAYWRKLAPGLHVDDAEFQAKVKQFTLPASAVAAHKKRLVHDGFFTLAPEDLPWVASLPAMRVGVRRLMKRGWPASMLLVYDEVWAMAHQLSSLMAAVSGGCANSLDMLAWSITPSLGQAGFAPHRDRQPANVPGSFHDDGTPKYCTAWVALSTASTENSCLYLVPRQNDPGYDEGDDQSPDAEDPLISVLRSDAAVQAVRACPLPKGGVLIFSHRAMHWGSRGREDCDSARISVSFGHSDPSFEAPYFAQPQQHLPFPRPPARIALAAAQLINYHERFSFGCSLLRRLGATVRKRQSIFSREYAEKTTAEFKAALDDRTEGHGREAAGSSDEDAADAALDDALDAMLDAQTNAEGNLFDDFDDYAEESDSGDA